MNIRLFRPLAALGLAAALALTGIGARQTHGLSSDISPADTALSIEVAPALQFADYLDAAPTNLELQFALQFNGAPADPALQFADYLDAAPTNPELQFALQFNGAPADPALQFASALRPLHRTLQFS